MFFKFIECNPLKLIMLLVLNYMCQLTLSNLCIKKSFNNGRLHKIFSYFLMLLLKMIFFLNNLVEMKKGSSKTNVYKHKLKIYH